MSVQPEVFQIESIKNHREKRGRPTEFLISWKGYPGEDTWEPRDALEADGLGDDIKKYLNVNLMLDKISRRARRVKNKVVEVRKPGHSSPQHKAKPKVETTPNSDDTANDRPPARSDDLAPGTYWITRIVFLKFLAFVYLVAFLVAFEQNGALIGSDGLLPARKQLNRLNSSLDESLQPLGRFMQAPTLMWWFPDVPLDLLLEVFALCGTLLSAAVLVMGSANSFMMSALWILYFSIDQVGGRWYSFGWESQLLETGFLAIFVVPVISLSRVPDHFPTPWGAIWGYRWLIFRIMIGAGLIKIRGDQCWRDLTCMDYHYETQPVPSPASWFFHATPTSFHKLETAVNHFVELVAPWLVLLSRPWRTAGGVVQILFQAVLICSGNLSFLNWLTIVPSIFCLDDRFMATVFCMGKNSELKSQVLAQQQRGHGDGHGKASRTCIAVRKIVHCGCLPLLIAWLSVPVVRNLLALEGYQAMNTNFHAFKIVNTYGAFGSITKARTEVVLQGSDASDPNSPQAIWKEYEFKCKPGSVGRRPCLISPYHYRLDWLMWFAAFGKYQHHPWLLHLTTKLLTNHGPTSRLLAHNPFQDSDPPKFIRAEHYSYKFAPPGSSDWWVRERIGEYFPPVSLENPSLRQFIEAHGWNWPGDSDR